MTQAEVLPRAVSPWQAISDGAKARRRRLLTAVAVLFVLVSVPFGFPTGRDVITAWVLVLLWAACGGEWRTWRRAVVRDWLPLIAVLFLYDLLRGSADELGSRLVGLPALANGKTGSDGIDHAHVLPQLRADELLFGWATGGQVPTVWLQERLHTVGEVRWWDVAIVPSTCRTSWCPWSWPVVLWLSAYALFRRYVWTLVALTLLTLATYACSRRRRRGWRAERLPARRSRGWSRRRSRRPASARSARPCSAGRRTPTPSRRSPRCTPASR
jgi:hypothetical protein